MLAVALVDARDQLLADVPREVEIDVRRFGDLLVQEAPQEQPVAHRIDVREPGEVADDRADARAAPAPGRQERPRRVPPPDLGGDVTSQLEDVEVEQQEPRQPQRADQPQLLLQAPSGLAVLGFPRVAVLESCPADLGQRAIGPRVLRPRVAVAEVPSEVELEPLGDARAFRDRVGMVREPGGHRRRRGEVGRPVPAPLGLRLLQRPPEANGDQRVLERRPRGIVQMDVARRHASNAEPIGEARQPAVARLV